MILALATCSRFKPCTMTLDIGGLILLLKYENDLL